MDTVGLQCPTALSLSDKGYLLTAFSCGSIALYDKQYTTPITVWYHQTPFAITQIKWCLLYFDDADLEGEDPETEEYTQNGYQNFGDDKVRFAARICEFFAIDQSEDFQIWNLFKATSKPAHIIHFSDRHKSSENN